MSFCIIKDPLINASVIDLPFNRFVGIERAADETQLLRLPGGGQYLNHLGTVHASALLALAEAGGVVHPARESQRIMNATLPVAIYVYPG